MKWAYLVTAPGQLVAEMWCDLLLGEGVPALVQPEDAVSFLGLSASPCRILVPEDRLEAARALLAQHLTDQEPSSER